MRTPIIDGRSIDQFIPVNLRGMFYKHFMPQYKYAIHNGYAPYAFPTNGLVLCLPLWALKGSSFKSVDRYKHTCTVGGATWYPAGRDFNGTTNYISVADVASIQNIFDGGGTYLAWIKPDSDGEADQGRILDKSGGGANGYWIFTASEAAGFVKIDSIVSFSTAYGRWATTNAVVPIGSYSFIAFTYNSSNVANNPLIYLNGVSQAVTESQAPVGTRNTDVGQNLIIGSDTAGAARTFDGIEGEVWGYNRILPVEEIAHIRNCTRWRYQ